MKAFNFILGLVAALSFVACGGDDDGGGAAPSAEAQLTVLSRGSGGTCPDITGSYSCTEVREGLNNNTSSELISYSIGRDSQNRQTFSQGNQLSLIADGQIHDVSGTQSFGSETIKYSIDCSGNDLTFHMVTNDKNATKVKLTKNGDQLSGVTTEILDGVSTTKAGACTKTTNIAPSEINQLQGSTSEETAFNIFSWLWSFIP